MFGNDHACWSDIHKPVADLSGAASPHIILWNLLGTSMPACDMKCRLPCLIAIFPRPELSTGSHGLP